MTATIDLSQDAVLGSLCRFLETVVPPPFEAVVGQVNVVPQPSTSNFAVVTPLSGSGLSTTRARYDDRITTGFRCVTQPTELTAQVDLYGENAADNAQLVSTLFRDLAGTEWFAADLPGVRPLYADEARQTVFLDEAAQYLDRRTLTVHLQVNPEVTLAQQFADQLRVTLVPPLS